MPCCSCAAPDHEENAGHAGYGAAAVAMKRAAAMVMPVLWCCLVLPPGIEELAADDLSRRKDAAAQEARDMGYGGQNRQRELTQQGATVVPAYQGSAVPEAGYYSDADAMTEESVRQMEENESGEFVNQSYYQRRRFPLNADTDPLLLLGKDIRDSPQDYATIADDGSGECATRERRTELPPFTEQYCTAWNASHRTCRHHCYCSALADGLDTSIRSDMSISYDYPLLTAATPESETWSGPCREHDREINFTINDMADIADWQIIGAAWTDHLRVSLNGIQVFIGPHTGDQLQAVRRTVNVPVSIPRQHCRAVASQYIYLCKGSTTIGTTSYCCELVYDQVVQPRVVWRADYGVRDYDCAAGAQSSDVTVDLKPHLRLGENKLTVRTLVASRGTVDLRMRLRLPCDCRRDGSISDGLCQGLVDATADGRCQSVRSACLPDVPRCGYEEQEYLCLGTQLTEEDYCGELRERGCGQIGSRCVDSDENGICKESEQKYRCPSAPVESETVSDCGKRISCLAGDCFDTSYRSSEDFPLAASHLSALDELTADFDEDNLRLFSGRGRQCKKTILGFSNCCRDSGWGVDLGLSRCSRQEQELGEMRQQGLCHYVGSYKTGRLFSKKRYQSYCCFGSLLGRIIQEQGRDQLSRAWGSARAPDCRGFHINEVSTLDFEQFDFREFYTEAESRADAVARPDAAELSERLREHVRRLSAPDS